MELMRMEPDNSTEELDFEETVGKLRKAMGLIQEVNDDIVKHKSDFNEDVFMQLKVPLGRAISELSYANRKFEYFLEILKKMETADEE